MAGSISLSLSQQLDTLGKPLKGGLLYFYTAGTTTPQSAYQDYGLTIPWPNPITLDSAGRIPQLFFADGYIKIRLTNAVGVTQIAADYILVVGPSTGGGGGGGGSVDATAIFTTGDLKHAYGLGVVLGWVRCNGRSIGSATSGATERANADTQTLFEYLWQNDSNLSVSGGRGASSTADWGANKNIALPDLRGRTIAGLDDMGNLTAGRLTSSYFGATATTLGAAGGSESRTLTLAQLPTGITAGGLNTITVTPGANSVPVIPGGFSVASAALGTTGGSTNAPVISTGWGASGNMQGNNTISVTSNNTSGAAHATVPPTLLTTIYMKL